MIEVESIEIRKLWSQSGVPFYLSQLLFKMEQIKLIRMFDAGYQEWHIARFDFIFEVLIVLIQTPDEMRVEFLPSLHPLIFREEWTSLQ